MTEAFVHIENLNVRFRRNVVLEAVSWTIAKGEQYLLTGASGSGKTTLAKALAGLIQTSASIRYTAAVTPKIRFIAQWYPFKDKTGSSNFYYQQRYNSTEAEDCNTVWEEISKYAATAGKTAQAALDILEAFDLQHRKDAPLIQLSSGEHKKLQLTKALLSPPQLLILDNPYTGLDVNSRQNLNSFLNEACDAGMQLLLISNDGDEPACINRFAKLDGGHLTISTSPFEAEDIEPIEEVTLPEFLTAPFTDFKEIIRLNKVNVKYGAKQVLYDISWQVSKGDKWLLQGPNGSGKSTLLSLLTGDHPQAYANEIYLFGKKRGSGESIWDIKQQIGFISPELQWFFDPASTVFQAIASGFFDTAGLFRTLNSTQVSKVHQLLQLMGLTDEEQTLLTQLPLGKQRLALLARAIIKNPPLLILDEPCQGLDQQQTMLFNQLVDVLCTGMRTLIYVGHFQNRLPSCIAHRLSLKEGRAQQHQHHLETTLNGCLT